MLVGVTLAALSSLELVLMPYNTVSSLGARVVLKTQVPINMCIHRLIYTATIIK